jgi:hypothetical protein
MAKLLREFKKILPPYYHPWLLLSLKRRQGIKAGLINPYGYFYGIMVIIFPYDIQVGIYSYITDYTEIKYVINYEVLKSKHYFSSSHPSKCWSRQCCSAIEKCFHSSWVLAINIKNKARHQGRILFYHCKYFSSM